MIADKFCNVTIVLVFRLGIFVQSMSCFAAARYAPVSKYTFMNYSVAATYVQEKETSYAECYVTLVAWWIQNLCSVRFHVTTTAEGWFPVLPYWKSFIIYGYMFAQI